MQAGVAWLGETTCTTALQMKKSCDGNAYIHKHIHVVFCGGVYAQKRRVNKSATQLISYNTSSIFDSPTLRSLKGQTCQSSLLQADCIHLQVKVQKTKHLHGFYFDSTSGSAVPEWNDFAANVCCFKCWCHHAVGWTVSFPPNKSHSPASVKIHLWTSSYSCHHHQHTSALHDLKESFTSTAGGELFCSAAQLRLLNHWTDGFKALSTGWLGFIRPN